MVEVVENGLRRWGERERKRAIGRAVTCRREDCFPRRVAFIFKWISASAEDEQVFAGLPPARGSRIF